MSSNSAPLPTPSFRLTCAGLRLPRAEKPKRQTARELRPILTLIAMASLLATLPGCDRPLRFVFVLQAPQSVELAASASTQSTKTGAPVVLHATRQTRGVWKQILSKDLQSDQCWMSAIPPTREPAVADNVHWRVEPAIGVKFNVDLRPGRTREVSMAHPGTYTFVASTAVWCEPGRSVPAIAVQVTVEAP